MTTLAEQLIDAATDRDQKDPQEPQETPCAGGGKHKWRIARRRGKKVRHQCSKCKRMDPWTKVEVRTKEKKAVAPEMKEVLDATFWNGATVADLKQMAKEKGITGYSKMKRDDLLKVLS
jgi:hypothetical protein